MIASEKLYLQREAENLLSDAVLEIHISKTIIRDALRDDDTQKVLKAIEGLNTAVSIIQDFENKLDNIYFKKKETRK